MREFILGGNSESFGSVANVAYRMSADEYARLCPYAGEIEKEWGAAPGRINSFGRDLLIQGVRLGNVFVAVQPTFGYEGDPMKMLMSRGAAPHHGFAALYAYIEKVFGADAVVHTGTHGALEFMPGKQVGPVGRVLARPFDWRASSRLYLQRQQPLGRLNRPAALLRRTCFVPDSPGRGRGTLPRARVAQRAFARIPAVAGRARARAALLRHRRGRGSAALLGGVGRKVISPQPSSINRPNKEGEGSMNRRIVFVRARSRGARLLPHA